MEGLLPIFGIKNNRGLLDINNGGEYKALINKSGEKVIHLLSIPSDSAVRAFELTIYCNYTILKCELIIYGLLESLMCKKNILGKDGIQEFSLKSINENIYLFSYSDTSLFDVRLKPLVGIENSFIVNQFVNEIDLSFAKKLCDL